MLLDSICISGNRVAYLYPLIAIYALLQASNHYLHKQNTTLYP
nr:MAG TPA: hypothetical protein [Caudoviricetes sp.]